MSGFQFHEWILVTGAGRQRPSVAGVRSQPPDYHYDHADGGDDDHADDDGGEEGDGDGNGGAKYHGDCDDQGDAVL